MKKFLSVAIALCLSACATTKAPVAPQLPEAYIPKHPELSLPDPTYRPLDVAKAKAIAQYIEQALSTAPQQHASLKTFVEIAGGLYINAHRAQIMDCTDKRGNKAGPGMADPECVWPRPSADDWVGCMAYQFDGVEAEMQQFKLDTVRDDETVFIWIDRNYDAITAQPGGLDFITQLNGMPILGAACDQLTQDEVPNGQFRT